MNLDKIIDIVRRQKLNEMMTVGAGGIAGTVEAGDDPPVRKKKKKKDKKKYISLGRGARTVSYTHLTLPTKRIV